MWVSDMLSSRQDLNHSPLHHSYKIEFEILCVKPGIDSRSESYKLQADLTRREKCKSRGYSEV